MGVEEVDGWARGLQGAVGWNQESSGAWECGVWAISEVCSVGSLISSLVYRLPGVQPVSGVPSEALLPSTPQICPMQHERQCMCVFLLLHHLLLLFLGHMHAHTHTESMSVDTDPLLSFLTSKSFSLEVQNNVPVPFILFHCYQYCLTNMGTHISLPSCPVVSLSQVTRRLQLPCQKVSKFSRPLIHIVLFSSKEAIPIGIPISNI